MQAKPIVPWMGGKRRLAKHIISILPAHQCYVEPFAGGAAILFHKPISHVEVINDLNADLVNLYRVVQHHLEEFVRQFKWALVSRQTFLWHQEARPDTLTDIQRAARFYYLQKLAFGAKPVGQTFGTSAMSPPKLNLLRMEEDLSAAHLRLSRVTIERLDWAECIRRYDRPDTLFYCDPPYWQTAGYGGEFGMDQYERMASLAKSVKGKMLISINDHPDIRKAFAGLAMKRVGIRYTVGGNGRSDEVGELLIRSWD